MSNSPRPIIKKYSVNGKTPWIPLDRSSPHKTFMVKDPAGTATFTLEHLIEDPQKSDFNGVTTDQWIADTNINASTGEAAAIGSSGAMAVRLSLSGVTGDVSFTITQGAD